MLEFHNLGNILILFGFILVGVGVFLPFMPKVPLLAKLPGDIMVRRGNFTFYFPWVTCLLISTLLTPLLTLFRR